MIKCGLCGLTFSGTRASARQPDHYYHCNGRQFARGLYGLTGKKCPGKSINGEYVERVIWADIESFLRDPGEILDRLRERLSTLARWERGEREPTGGFAAQAERFLVSAGAISTVGWTAIIEPCA